MKGLRINSACQPALESVISQPNARFGAGVLVGQLENQNYLVVDVMPLNYSDPIGETTTFKEFLTQVNDQEENAQSKLLNMVSNVKMMLVGGLSMVGLVIRTEFADFDTNSFEFKGLVDSMKEVMPGKTEVTVIVQNKSKKREDFLLYDFNQRKFNPIDYQFISFKDRLFKLSTSVEAELIVSVGRDQNGALRVSDISEKLKHPIRLWTADMSHGIVKVGGSFFDKTETLDNIKAKLQQKEGTLECEIFSSFPIQKVYAISEEEKSETVITFKGIFTAFAYVLAKKVTLKDAYMTLVTDMLQSVQNKLNLFVSENEEILDQELAQNRIFFLPNRTYFEFTEKSSNPFTYCDYLMSGENLTDCESRLKEWFNLTSKPLNTAEHVNAENFNTRYLKLKEKSKTTQQKEGVIQRKTDKKESENKEEKPAQNPTESLKDNNIVKYGVLVGAVLVFILIRFLVF